MTALGTVLMVWAHPDDETYLVGGLSAALTDAGQRVVCVTATRGEAGGTDRQVSPRSGRRSSRRRWSCWASRSTTGWTTPTAAARRSTTDQAAARIRALVDDVRPDTVVTFGPDGFTGHPDHRAVSRWTDLALARATDGALLHAVAREQPSDPELDEDFGVFELGRPRVCADDEIDVLLPLDAALLDRKVERCCGRSRRRPGWSQPVGLERFRAWVATEAFAAPAGTT